MYEAEHIDEWLRESIRQAGGQYDNDTGWYKPITISGIPNAGEAHEIEKAIRRSAYYMFRKKQHYIGSHVSKHKQPDGTYNITYVAVHKDYTYKYMIEHYGEDRQNWPYSTSRHHPNYNSGN